jgi:hypothetical protein
VVKQRATALLGLGHGEAEGLVGEAAGEGLVLRRERADEVGQDEGHKASSTRALHSLSGNVLA